MVKKGRGIWTDGFQSNSIWFLYFNNITDIFLYGDIMQCDFHFDLFFSFNFANYLLALVSFQFYTIVNFHMHVY